MVQLLRRAYGQGRENVRNYLKENKETFARIDAELRKKLGLKASEAELPAVPLDGIAQATETVRTKRMNPALAER